MRSNRLDDDERHKQNPSHCYRLVEGDNRESGVIKALRACSLLLKAHIIRRINAAVYNSLEGVGCGVLLAAKRLPL